VLCLQLPDVAWAQQPAKPAATGAELELAPWDGDVFTFRVLPLGRFAPMVATNTGPRVSGFAQFEMGQDGKLSVLHLRMVDGQAYDFRRE
jgi:hypothetical protein